MLTSDLITALVIVFRNTLLFKKSFWYL